MLFPQEFLWPSQYLFDVLGLRFHHFAKCKATAKFNSEVFRLVTLSETGNTEFYFVYIPAFSLKSQHGKTKVCITVKIYGLDTFPSCHLGFSYFFFYPSKPLRQHSKFHHQMCWYRIPNISVICDIVLWFNLKCGHINNRMTFVILKQHERYC